MSSEGRLSTHTAIVTGSGRNIGRAIALRFAAEGANVVVNGHSDRGAVDAVVAEIASDGGNAIGVMADVSKPDEVSAMVAAARAAFGKVDIIVSNVGVRKRQRFEEITIEDWRQVMETNLGSAFFLAHYTIPAMREGGWGRVINISGYDGWTGHISERAHNMTAKAGMHALSKAIAREYGIHGITANTVAPGAIRTVRDPSQYAHLNREAMIDRLAIKSAGEPEDIAQACLYLAGESGKYVTGQVIHVNGGEFMF